MAGNKSFLKTSDLPSKSKARTVKIFLVDGEPEGIRSAAMDVSTTFAIAFKRDQLNLGVKTEFANEIGKSGVYLIIGADPSNSDKKMVYVGEADDVRKRLNIHKGIIKGSAAQEAEEPGLAFWEDTVVFVSTNDSLTKSHIRYAEAVLIASIDGKSPWSNCNKKKPPYAGKLPKEDAVSMNKVVDEIKILAGSLGFDLFKAHKLPAPEAENGTTSAAQSENPEFIFAGNGFNAKAVFLSGSTGEWVVRAKSLAKLEHASATPKGAVKLRVELEANGVLKKTSDGLEFTVDRGFPSASAAACLVSGTSVAGPIAWKRNGQTYRDWEAAFSGETTAAA
jgi:hypothetical protein